MARLSGGVRCRCSGLTSTQSGNILCVRDREEPLPGAVRVQGAITMSRRPYPQVLLAFSDQPLESDQDLRFQFHAYASSLARLISAKKTRTPLTICINGEWGSGKTTLMKAIERRLDEALRSIDYWRQKDGFYPFEFPPRPGLFDSAFSI